MRDNDICDLIRREAATLGWGPSQLSNRASVAKPTVHNFLYSRHNCRLHTAVALLKALGYEIQIVKVAEPEVNITYRDKKDHSRTYYNKVKPENDCACDKCGRDAGVVEVHGHLQCVHCGHIVQDCCGD